MGAVGLCCAKAIGAHNSSASAATRTSATDERPMLLCGVRRIRKSPNGITTRSRPLTDTCGRKADAVSQRTKAASRCLVVGVAARAALPSSPSYGCAKPRSLHTTAAERLNPSLNWSLILPPPLMESSCIRAHTPSVFQKRRGSPALARTSGCLYQCQVDRKILLTFGSFIASALAKPLPNKLPRVRAIQAHGLPNPLRRHLPETFDPLTPLCA